MADGRITIDTKIDARGVVDGTDKIMASLGNMAKEAGKLKQTVADSFSAQTDSIMKSVKANKEQKKAVEEASQAQKEMSEQQVPTEEYKKFVDSMKELEEQAEKITKQQQEWLNVGFPLDSDAFAASDAELEKIYASMKKIQQQQEEMKSNGTAFVGGGSVEAPAASAVPVNDLNGISGIFERLKAKMNEYAAAFRSSSEYTNYFKSSIGGLSIVLTRTIPIIGKFAGMLGKTVFNGMISGLKNLSRAAQKASMALAQLVGRGIVGGLRKITSGIFGMNKAVNKSTAGFGVSLKTIIKYGFGIRSLYALVNKLRTAIREGFKNLAQYSNNTNAAISGLMSSLAQCKNALATAFDPILQAVAPALNYMISLITAAATAMAQLIAIITGKGTFIKATKVQKYYAKSLKATGGAAKGAGEEAEGALAPFDKLNVMAEDASKGGAGGGGGGSSIEDMFETVPVESAFKDLAAKIKGIWSGVFDTLRKAWKNKGQPVINSAKSAFNSLFESAKSVGTTFYDVFTSNTGVTWVESILNLLRSALDIIGAISTAFRNAWNSGSGMENVTALFTMLTNVNNLLADIGDSFSRAFSSGVGAAIFTNLIGILTGVYNIIGSIASQLDLAWNTAGVGDRIFNGILAIINTILETIHNIVDSTAEWAGKLNFTPLLESVSTLLEALEPLTETVGEGLEWFWNNVLLPISGWVIEEAVPKFLDMLSAAIDALNKVIETIKPVAQWFWDEFLEPFGKWTGEKIISAIEKVTELLEDFGDWITEHKEEVQQFATIVGMVGAAFLGANVAIALVTASLPILGLAIRTLFGVITGPVGIVAAMALMVVATGHGEEMITNLKNTLEGLKEFIVGVFTGDWERAWNGAKQAVEGFVESLRTLLESAMDMIDKLLGKTHELKETANGPIGQLSSGPHKLMGRSISTMALTPNIEPVSLPRLASGTVVPPRAGEFAAILGDNNREAEVVSPISTMKQAFLEAFGEVGDMGGGDIIAHIYLDGKELGRSTVKFVREETKRTGRNPLLV